MEALIPFLFVFVIMYVALILPQQRQKKAERQLVASLSEGDEVVLNSGIHGFINSIDENIVWVEVASGVELKVSKAAIAHRVADPTTDATASDDDDDAADDDDDDMNAGLGDTDVIEADD